jgi:tRNA-dihydrouridine synthase
MEGITGYVYRKAFDQIFGGVDKYFTPFLSPNQHKCLSSRERNDILPAHNRMDHALVVPQILTKSATDFISTCHELKQYGYDEVNLNLGCPSMTVVSKGRGAGFLAKPVELEHFLDEIVQKSEVNISIKTRIGIEHLNEFQILMQIFNKFSLKELIIHPRLQKEYYKNKPHWEVFKECTLMSKNPLVYNGDLFTAADFARWRQKFPEISRVMLGRGLLVHPGLLVERLDKTSLQAFHDFICQGYVDIMAGERNVLFKMKELWFYLIRLFPDSNKLDKKIRKARGLSEYCQVVEQLFFECELVIPERLYF